MSELNNTLLDENPVDPPAPETNPADVRMAAMNLLARREHSQRELRQKLGRRFDDVALVEHEIQRLAEQNLQSDQRFAESFVRQRAGRGCGLVRVRQEMRQKGLSDSEIELAVDAAEIDWSELAVEVYEKKFAHSAPVDLKEKAKRIRFMQYRGFDRDDFQYLLDAN